MKMAQSILLCSVSEYLLNSLEERPARESILLAGDLGICGFQKILLELDFFFKNSIMDLE